MIKTLVAVLILLAGISVILFAAQRWRQWRRVRSWQPIRGEVIEARVKEVWDFAHGMKSRAPAVEYRYRVGSYEFTGRRVTVHDRHLASIDPAHVKTVLERIGSHPLVYTDPSDRGNAVLVNRLERPHFDYLLTRIVIGVLLVTAGVALYIVVPAA